MAALRFLRARTATSLAVTAAVGVSTAWIASSPPSLAASAHARGPAGDPARGPALRGPTKHAPPPGSPVSNPSTTPPVRTTARGLPSAAGAGAPAGTSESPQRPEHLSSRSANLSAREQRGRDGDPHRSHDSNPRAALSSPGIGPTQAKGRAPHGPAPAAEVSQAGEPAAQTLREPAVAGKGPAGPKQGGNGKHAKAAGGKHKVPSGVATRASSPSAGADAGSAPKDRRADRPRQLRAPATQPRHYPRAACRPQPRRPHRPPASRSFPRSRVLSPSPPASLPNARVVVELMRQRLQLRARRSSVRSSRLLRRGQQRALLRRRPSTPPPRAPAHGRIAREIRSNASAGAYPCRYRSRTGASRSSSRCSFWPCGLAFARASPARARDGWSASAPGCCAT